MIFRKFFSGPTPSSVSPCRYHASGSRLAIPYRAYGAILFGGALLPLSYWSFNQHVNASHSQFMAIGMSAAILLLAVTVFGIAEWLRYSQLMSCPACERRTWLGVSWAS